MIWLIVAIILWRTVVPLGKLIRDFPLNDFSVYIDGTKAALSGENPYKLKFFDRFNYPPAAALFFMPLSKLPIQLSEWIFTTVSVISLWLAVSWTLKILDWEPTGPLKWLIFALSLKMFPMKLTLALGQINLIILALLVGSFYFCEGLALRSKARPFKILSGILLGLAIVLKLTPAPILIYFLIRKKWKVIKWSAATIAVLTVIGGIVFGWDLTRYYFVSVVPGLMGEVTKETVNASYMNQSVTALLARVGTFGFTNASIRLLLSGGMFLIVMRSLLGVRQGDSSFDFRRFWSLAVISTLFLPVFVWQHHYVMLLPAWLILAAAAFRRPRSWLTPAAIITYLLINFRFTDPYLPAQLPPILATHFLFTGMLTIMAVSSIKETISFNKQK